VLFFHWRAGFRRWTMYGPVLLAPVLVVEGVLGALQRDGLLGRLVPAVFTLGIVDRLVGVRGSCYHRCDR
jgi:hypothetical protein